MTAWSRPNWRAGLLILAMTAPVLRPARIAALDSSATASSRERAVSRRHRLPGLEQRVSMLTRALALDASQQSALRRVLLEQRAQAQRIWSDAALPSANRIAATKALSRQTADRIRALLNPEQRKNYDLPLPDGSSQTIANARLEDWMHARK